MSLNHGNVPSFSMAIPENVLLCNRWFQHGEQSVFVCVCVCVCVWGGGGGGGLGLGGVGVGRFQGRCIYLHLFRQLKERNYNCLLLYLTCGALN